MLIQEIIRKKRDQGKLSTAEIRDYITQVTDGSAGEGQVAAMCMAILLNGLDSDERVNLTMAMARSGDTVDWAQDALPGPVLDKHSTGGVGDKVSLMLAPIVAACGGYVPMISGRGLGHTGGTLDKMDAIPGYVSQPDLPMLKSVVTSVGCAIVGATKEIAPADKRIYAIRDVTGTVESLDLITASILSKKLAAGLQGLVMDVKFGTGAFMQDYAKARELAQSIVSVANGAGVQCTALMTDMNEALGRTAGNAIEVREAVEFLRGDDVDRRLHAVTLALCGELLAIGGLAADAVAGRMMAEEALSSGKAADYFGRMVAALGGPSDIVENFAQHLPLAGQPHEVYSEDGGTVVAVDTRALGLAVIELGGGRRLASDKIDHGVGLGALAAIGERVGPRERPLAVIHGREDATVALAERMIREAYTLGNTASATKDPIAERIAL
jgi:thymidine phosphorylase